jgi:acyl-CoA hydrolase
MVNGVLTSRILPQFPAGSVVSTPRHQLDIIITEHGIAELEGRSIRERSRALAMIGHPQFRDELLANAEQWPKD